MTLTTRLATPADASGLCDVINPIIEKGGTTAHLTLFDPARALSHYIAAERGISCVVAEDRGALVGFQSLTWPDPDYPDGDLPEGWAIIGSFVRGDQAGRGVGQALFAATQAHARAAGVKVIDATIADYNRPGLGFYAKMGFTDYTTRDTHLSDGTPVRKICKKFEL